MNIRIAAETDKGYVREQNEDAFCFCPDLSHPDWERSEASIELGPNGCLLALADGIGGVNAGEVASAIAMDTVRQQFSNITAVAQAVGTETGIIQFLQSTIEEADKAIKQYAVDHPDSIGLGTTIVLSWICNGIAYVAWCGDSRCYLFNPNIGLLPLTKDHSYVQELVDKKELTESEAFCHPDSNIITRGLGDLDAQALPDITTHALTQGDTIMLCSDGLCGYSTNQVIERIVSDNYLDAGSCCHQLLRHALNVGGYDNICIVVASIAPKRNIFKRWFSHHLIKK